MPSPSRSHTAEAREKIALSDREYIEKIVLTTEEAAALLADLQRLEEALRRIASEHPERAYFIDGILGR